MPRSARTSVVRAETIESFGATGLAQLNQLIRMKTEVIHHGTTAEKRITAARRRTRVY